MKILNINKYHYRRGGSDTVYLNTAKLLEEKGHQVLHFAMNFPENLISNENEYFAASNDFTQASFVKKLRNFPSFFYNKNASENLQELISARKPDIAHLHIFYGSLSSSILNTLKKNNIPVVVSIHDYKIPCPAYLFLDGENKICEKCAGKKYYNCFLNTCVKNNKVFSLAFAMEAYFRDFFFPPAKMINKLVFVSKFSRDIHLKYKNELSDIADHLYNFDPNIKLKSGNPEKGAYFLYAGRLSREKGVHTLIEAFRSKPELNLKIVGTGPVISEINEIPSNIELCGFQSGEKLEKLISDASFVIVPSEWYENNPMAIIEAYSLGKPVIAAAIGGIPEIVENNKTGYLFESGNVSDLLKKIELADGLSQEEYTRFSHNSRISGEKKFHPDTHYQNLIRIYESILT